VCERVRETHREMPEDDPFFTVRDEVQTALAKARQLYERWNDLITDQSVTSKDELEWTTTELRNGLRSIEWDLEDLEETVSIVEANPKKFKFDTEEIVTRRQFITDTRNEVSQMRDIVADAAKGQQGSSSKRTTVASLMNSGLNSVAAAVSGNDPTYTKLIADMESPLHGNSYGSPTASPESCALDVADFDIGVHQSLMLRNSSASNSHLNRIENSMSALKDVSRNLGQRTTDHSVMLDDVDGDLEVTTSRADFAFKKIARTLGLQTNKRQWIALGVMSFVLLAIVVLIVR